MGAGETDALPLPAGEPDPQLADLGLDAFGQLAKDRVTGPAMARCFPGPLMRRLIPPIAEEHVLLDAAGEQDRFLGEEADPGARAYPSPAGRPSSAMLPPSSGYSPSSAARASALFAGNPPDP